jgi:hypothetical protein
MQKAHQLTPRRDVAGYEKPQRDFHFVYAYLRLLRGIEPMPPGEHEETQGRGPRLAYPSYRSTRNRRLRGGR